MRKLILRTLCAVAALIPAFAQPNPIQCQTNVAVTPTLRSEGFTGLMGDVTLICTGGVATAANAPVPTATISMFMNTAVTSRTYANGFSEVLLLVNDPNSGVVGTAQTALACADPSGTCSLTGNGTGAGQYDGSPGHPNVFPGKVAGNTVTFTVPIDAPMVLGAVLTIRMTNIRVNATSLGGGSAAGATPVVASISVSGVSLLINNATPTTGFVQSGLGFSMRTPDNSSASNGTTITQCSTPTRAGVLRFAEAFPNAAQPRTSATFIDGETSPPPAVQNVAGAIYPGESWYYNPTLSAPTVNFSTAGLADAGTRFRAAINNVPPGSQVFVSARNVVFSGGTPIAASSGTVARLTQNEGSAFSPTPSSRTLDGIPAVQLPLVNGAANAVWEVLGANYNGNENFDFLVWVQPGATLGTGTVNGSFAPAPPTFSAGVPRFIADPNAAKTLFITSGCQVNAPTTTTLAASISAPLTVGTLTATVKSSAGAPTGTVTFYDNSVAIPNSTTTLTVNGIAPFTTTFNAGSHSFTATYTPANDAFLTSTSPAFTLNLPKLNTSILLTSSNVPAVPGQLVTITATVNAPFGVPGGTMQFNDGGQPLGGVTFTGGVARLTTPFAAGGPHDISASYSGDANFNTSSAHFVQSVSKLTAALGISASVASVDFGAPVKLTATLNAAPPAGVTAPSGVIQFFDGATSLGTPGLNNGGATLTATNLGPGAHTFSATYSGDATWNPVKSGDANVTVGKGTANTVLSLAATSAQTTFNATVTATAGNVVPGGTVQFTDSTTGNPLGTATIAGGKASLVLTAGNLIGLTGHAVIAGYSGDASFVSGTSNTVYLATIANTAGGPSINFAADEFATIYGAGLAADTAQAPSGDFPVQLSDVTVTVVDAIGGVRPAG
ncbi:MAG TPA: Ig-like domain-containing protein, partial [Candidatus Solibacter sp.]|nr:Ig-like domain-containing protein [Candidatus Solibacter sp.]